MGCGLATLSDEPALYVPAAGADGIECVLCEACQMRIRFGDRALCELVELRLLIVTSA